MSSSPRTVETTSAEETGELGAELAATLAPGDVVLLTGEVGAGKSTLIRAACRALGVRGAVTSPTFTVGRRYDGRVPVSHLDLDRLSGLGDEAPGLLDEYLTPDAVAFVEWPEAGEGEIERIALRVEIEHAGGDRRRIRIRRPGRGGAPGASLP